MALTRSRQRNAVSEGAALGLVLNGCSSLEQYSKMTIDLAFEAAFRDWAYHDGFPQVDTDLRNGSNGAYVLTHADEGKQTWCLYWDQSHVHGTICSRDADWDPNNPENVEHAVDMIYGVVPLEGWVALGRDLVQRLSR